MRGRRLAAALQQTEATIVGNLLGPRSVRRVGGVVCLTAPSIPHPFVNRAIGFGTLAEPGDVLLGRIAALYERAGTPPRLTLPGDLAGAATRRALGRNGFRALAAQHDTILVRGTRAIPDAPAVAGLTIERLRTADVATFARLAATSFPERPRFGDAVTPLARRGARSRTVLAFLARVDGEPAGTGLLTLVGPVGGLSTGTVLERFRGRGIQKALLVHRMREARRRGRTTCFSQTEVPASLHNMLELGWRIAYPNVYFERT